MTIELEKIEQLDDIDIQSILSSFSTTVNATASNSGGGTMKHALPSINPADVGTLTGAFRHIFNKMMQGVNGMLPAQVIEYTPGPPPRVQVQPLIPVLTTQGLQVQRGQIASLPVLQLGGGGFMITFPLKPGDLGWIEASDRDISLFLQTYKASQPNTFRLKDFADSRFIPDMMTGYVLQEGDEGKALIQSIDGNTKFTLSQDGSIEIIAPTRVTISSAGEIDVTADKINLTANSMDPFPLRINGDVYVTGKIHASGEIVPDAPPP